MTEPVFQFGKLGTAMRFAELEHRVISNNIANVNTPNFKTREMSFDDYLSSAAKYKSGIEDKSGTETRLTAGLEARSDGNNVDLDRELARLKRNTMLYRTFAQLLTSQMNMMRTAMTK